VKEIHGSASGIVRATPERCFSLLAAVDRYRDWNAELVRELEVLERHRDDKPTRVRAVIHVKQSPFMKNFELTVAVRAEPPHAIFITRIPNEPSDPEALELAWRVAPRSAGGATRIGLQFNAVASFIPGFLPLGGIGNLIAERLLDAATTALGGAAGDHGHG
jgi:ribosome-associated toxin RatA of RatAB toxin-antitoxin module